MRRLIAIGLVVAACSSGTPTLPDTLGDLGDEVTTTANALGAVFDTFFPSRVTLYERISELDTTAALGDLYDQVSRLEEPAIAADLERYTRFVGDLLLNSGEVDTAISRDSLERLATAWLSIEAGAGVLAVGLNPQWCQEVTPAVTADLCRPDIPDGYDAAVERAVRLFLARYRPLVRLPSAFGDGVRAVLAIELRGEVLATIDDALADLAGLTPPDSQRRGVQSSFEAHLHALLEIWDALPETPEGLALDSVTMTAPDGTTVILEDDETWRVTNEGSTAPDVLVVVRYGSLVGGGGTPGITVIGTAEVPPDPIWTALAEELTVAVCDGAEVFAAARTPLRVAFPESTLPALGELWFYGEGTGCP